MTRQRFLYLVIWMTNKVFLSCYAARRVTFCQKSMEVFGYCNFYKEFVQKMKVRQKTFSFAKSNLFQDEKV